MNQLLKGCREALEQVAMIIRATTSDNHLTDENLYTTLRLGSHTRHIVDHFVALLQGIDNGVIDYNRRNRDSVIESQVNQGLLAIEQLVSQIEQVADGPIEVISEIDCYQTVSQRFSSTVHRELLYLINHTIHHTAYMKLLVKPYHLTLPEGIGIAPGTASFLRTAHA